jgi:hypothetical protein
VGYATLILGDNVLEICPDPADVHMPFEIRLLTHTCLNIYTLDATLYQYFVLTYEALAGLNRIYLTRSIDDPPYRKRT